jgi:hypothetical protein
VATLLRQYVVRFFARRAGQAVEPLTWKEIVLHRSLTLKGEEIGRLRIYSDLQGFTALKRLPLPVDTSEMGRCALATRCLDANAKISL